MAIDQVPGPGERDEGEPIGPFATWRHLYIVVLTYGVALILLLLFLTRVLDPGTP